MLRSLIAVAIALPAVASAQDIRYFYTREECGPSNTMFAEAMDYGETPLFTGANAIFGTDGTPYYGTMMFTVNQDTGSWSMFTQYPDGTVCMVTFGGSFEPVTR